MSSTKEQTLSQVGDDEMLIIETNSFAGIPYSDHFIVVTRWAVIMSNETNMLAGQASKVQIQVATEIVFRKSTMLETRITRNTISELQEVYKAWGEKAARMLQRGKELPGDPDQIQEGMLNPREILNVRKMTVTGSYCAR